jgi:hypothetical protein
MMQGDLKFGMQCAEFDALLIDALDGVLAGAALEQFQAHANDCADCGPLFEHAREGMKLLRSLPELDAPANLVHNILAATSMADAHAKAPALPAMKQSWWQRAADWIAPGLAPAIESATRSVMQPRFAMTTAMAFFSLSVIVNLTGVKLADLRHLDLRPSAITNTAALQYNETTAKVVKYYENIRLVYELETRLRELKKNNNETPEQNNQQPQQQQQKPSDDNSTKNPRDQNQNYSLETQQVKMAKLEAAPAIRRIS